MTLMTPTERARAIDLTGGFPLDADLIDAKAPFEDPAYRAGVSIWFFNDAEGIQFPRFLVEDIPQQQRQQRLTFFNVAFPDGRACVQFAQSPSVPMLDAAGRADVYGTEACSFRCVEPFRRWTMRARTQLHQTTSRALLREPPAGPVVDVEVELEMECVAPAWEMGRFTRESGKPINANDMTAIGHGFRVEQHVLVRGQCKLGGETYPINGRGTRIHRRSIRAGHFVFRGHTWQSAVFPSGKAFAVQTFRPTEDGSPYYSEAYYFDGQTVHPADVVERCFLEVAKPGAQDVSVVIRTSQREIPIKAQTYATNFSVVRGKKENPAEGLLQQQACVRYSMDGEEAYGMMERMNFNNNVRIDD